MATRVTESGPLFDGSAAKIIKGWTGEIAGKLGTEAERRVLANLDGSLRHPTGAYRARITLYGPIGGMSRVHDRMGIYGPWLEGTSSRNRTTRFKGYANFRRAAQQVDRGAVALAENVIKQRIHELGG